MLWKVRIVLRTRHGILCSRNPRQRYWTLISGTRKEGESSWQDTAVACLRQVTGIPAYPGQLKKLRDDITQLKRDRCSRHRLIYCEAHVEDRVFLRNIVSHGPQNEHIDEKTYEEIREGGILEPGQRRILETLGLLKPPL